MTIATKHFLRAKPAINYLEKLAIECNNTIVFRGHSQSDYRLVTTWWRHRPTPHYLSISDVDGTLTAYKVGLEKLGISSFDHTNRFEAMEHARHHGVPTPCLDFSYSPYVALFFAFNGVRLPRGAKKPYSVIYALNIDQLAEAWAWDAYDPRTNWNEFDKRAREFKYPTPDDFENGYPSKTLKFIPFPGKDNTRMQHQLGCFIYDTLWYNSGDLENIENLEEYIAGKKEPPVSIEEKTRPGLPILTKVFISQQATSEVFSYLELMNMTGGYLYDSADGIALDIKNAYNYNPKFSYLRGIEFPSTK